jgi:hypothetical protein
MGDKFTLSMRTQQQKFLQGVDPNVKPSEKAGLVALKLSKSRDFHTDISKTLS